MLRLLLPGEYRPTSQRNTIDSTLPTRHRVRNIPAGKSTQSPAMAGKCILQRTRCAAYGVGESYLPSRDPCAMEDCSGVTIETGLRFACCPGCVSRCSHSNGVGIGVIGDITVFAQPTLKHNSWWETILRGGGSTATNGSR